VKRHSILLVEDDAVTRARLAEAIRAHAELDLLGEADSLAAARAELAQSTPPGTPPPRLHLTMLTSPERLRGDVARVVAQELEDVGVFTDVVPLELGTKIARLNAGDFDLAFLQLPEMTEPNVLRHFLHGALIPPAGANRGRVHDPELDALLDEAERDNDTARRRDLYARVEQRMREAMHLIPLFYEDQVVVTSERARSFLPSAEGRWLGLAALP